MNPSSNNQFPKKPRKNSEAQLPISNGVKNTNDIFKKLKTQKLAKSERALLKSKLDEYRAHTPMRADATAERISHTARHTTQKPAFGFLLFFKQKSMTVALALILAASLGGGTAFAAEGALPGDALYPIKTEVNEEVRAAFALDVEAKAEVEAWRAERRLQESQTLASRAELTDIQQEEIQERFNTHATRAAAHIDTVAETNPALAAELATRFGASLEAHEIILTESGGSIAIRISDEVRSNINNLNRVRIALGDEITLERSTEGTGTIAISTSAAAPESTDAGESTVSSDTAVRSTIAVSVDRLEAAKRMMAAAEKSIASAKALYARVQAKLDVTTQARVENFISETGAVFQKGVRQFNAELYGEAFISFQEVVRKMNLLSVFLKGHLDGRINLTPSDIDALDNTPSISITLPSGATSPSAPTVTEVEVEVDTSVNTQIDPPSLELDTGPEDTDDTDEKGEAETEDETTRIESDTRIKVEVGI